MSKGRASLLLATSMLVFTPGAAPGSTLHIDSREYKLMLDPAAFAGAEPEAGVEAFWDDVLKPVIGRSLDPKDSGEPRHEGKFKLAEDRRVRFFDTSACVLDRNGLSLRERIELSGRRETTLKLRSPDLFLAAGTKLEGDGEDPKTKLEEDIGPLLTRANDGTAVPADPPTIRSRFSRSTKQEVARDVRLRQLEDAADLYPTLVESLRDAGAVGLDPDADLMPGATFRELVFEGAEVDLGKEDAEFALTLWYRADGDPEQPELAELSFKYETSEDDGLVPLGVARRALALFVALQVLPAAQHDAETKTRFALPEPCRVEPGL